MGRQREGKTVLPVRRSPRTFERLNRGHCLAAFAFLLIVCQLPVRMPWAQVGAEELQSQPAPSPSPSPSPSPTPVTGLHQWGAVTLFHGLPSDRVLAVAQGRDGAMWFGTDRGLAKFDGRRTLTVTDPSLVGRRVQALKADADGGLWIGSDSGAVRLWSGRFEPIIETAGSTVTTIITAQPGRVLMATQQGMVFECISRDDGTRQVRSLLDQPVHSSDHDQGPALALTSLAVVGDKIYVGSQGRGLLTIEGGVAKEAQIKPAALFINSLESDQNRGLWVAAKSKKEESALFAGEPSKLTRQNIPPGQILTMRAAGGVLWLGTDGKGVFRITPPNTLQRFTFDGTAGGLRSDHIYSIFVDREDVVWFGTDRGVSRYDPNALRAEVVGTSPENNFVRTIYESTSGKLFAGTNRGLFVYEPKSQSWQSVIQLGRNAIYSLAEDTHGRLIVGTATGLYLTQSSIDEAFGEGAIFVRLEATSGNPDGPSIRALASFQDKIYMASSKRGLERLENSKVRFLWPTGSGSRDLLSLFADGKSQLLIGTANDGVLAFDGSQMVEDPVFSKLKGGAVRAIERSVDGTLWFATNQGVYFCPLHGQCELTAAGFDARSLVAADTREGSQIGNTVWCATAGGLLKISLDREHGPVISQFDVEQGLPSQNVFAILKQRNSENLLIGTSRGIVRYQPSLRAPTLYATRIISKRLHQPSELADGLKLEYPQNSLLLEVGAMSSRTFPEQFQFAFQLTDGKGQLIRKRLSKEPQFAMEGLLPGKYRVVARAFTKDLIPSEPLSFEFDIAGAPFPWTSTALAVLLALALLALLWAIMERRRIAHTSATLVKVNRELADARLNLANEAERERRRISRDLHDQTLADLRRLLLLTDSSGNNDQTAERRADKALFRQEIESISQEVRRICEDLSPSVLQNVGFSAALEFALSHAVEQAPPGGKFAYHYSCDETLDEHTRFSTNVQLQIYRITQEALSNIWRHSGATQVNLAVSCPSPDSDFVLMLSDNGTAFEPRGLDKRSGRGLANIYARARLIDAEISWQKGENGGTIFSLRRVQKKREHDGARGKDGNGVTNKRKQSEEDKEALDF